MIKEKYALIEAYNIRGLLEQKANSGIIN